MVAKFTKRDIRGLSALNEIARKMPVVMPLHPRTRKIIAAGNFGLAFEPIEPVGYFDMIELLSHAKLVMTYSGGLQKEAFFFKKPCVTLREETEWVELVEAGVNVLACEDPEKILGAFRIMREALIDYSVNLYGDGKASEKIVSSLYGARLH